MSFLIFNYFLPVLWTELFASSEYFDAIIALKIGNRLAIIKIVKKNHPCDYVVYFFLIIYFFIYNDIRHVLHQASSISALPEHPLLGMSQWRSW